MDDVPSDMMDSTKHSTEEEEYPLDLTKATQKIEIKNITKALNMSNGNKAKAAKILNIPRTTLYYKIDQYKIDESKIWHMTKFWQNDKL